MKAKCISFANFNPVALFSLILLALGLILGAVSVGIGQWSRLETARSDNGVQDGMTVKTIGLMSRCISYTVTTEILELGLTLEQQPMSGCISVGDVNCSLAGVPLVSALERDRYTHPEIHNSNDEGSCGKVKESLQVSAAFMILGVVVTAISLCLFFPFWHWVVIIVAEVLSVLTVIFYAIAMGVFVDTDQHFAGFFTLNGSLQDGCFSYGFGIALAAFLVNIIAAIIGVGAILYGVLAKRNTKKD